MTDDGPAQDRGEPAADGSDAVDATVAVDAAGRGDGLWLALLVPGALAAAALPLSVLGAPRVPWGVFILASRESLTRVLYLRGGVAVGPAGFPLGWYWTGVLAATVLATAAWYRRRDRATGRRGLPRGYLWVGAALVAMTAALPLLGWRTSPLSLGDPTVNWLSTLWLYGTFAQSAIAVTLGIVARSRRSRGLAVTAVIYAVMALLAGWVEANNGLDPLPYPYVNLTLVFPVAVLLLPAAVLLVAGVGRLLAAAARRPRPEP